MIPRSTKTRKKHSLFFFISLSLVSVLQQNYRENIYKSEWWKHWECFLFTVFSLPKKVYPNLNIMRYYTQNNFSVSYFSFYIVYFFLHRTLFFFFFFVSFFFKKCLPNTVFLFCPTLLSINGSILSLRAWCVPRIRINQQTHKL